MEKPHLSHGFYNGQMINIKKRMNIYAYWEKNLLKA